MNVIFHPSHGMNQNAELLANTFGVGPHARLKFPGEGIAPILGAEHNMNHILSVGVGQVSHLRCLKSSYTTHPALTHWANFCHAYGAGRSLTPTPVMPHGYKLLTVTYLYGK